MTNAASKIINILPLILNLIALIAVVWIIVPAPSASIWLFSVAASEWSLWIALASLVGIVLASIARLFYGERKIWLATIIVGSIVLTIALYPLFSALMLAREQNVSLSIKEYFSTIWKKDNDSDSKNAKTTTYAFARIDEKDLLLDVYSPTNKSENNGASVVVIHGGSWSSGVRSDFPQWNRWLAEQGFTVFDIDYRLSQPNYLSAIGDVKCAVRWIKNHAAEFNFSPDRMAVLGRSAGAHLALLAAYSVGDARLSASCETAADENLRAVVSFYAPTDLLWDFDNPANESVINGPLTLGNFLGGNPHEANEIRERYVLASPTAHVSNRTPPTLLIHGGRDQLVREENMRFLAEKLENANVPHQTVFIPYAQHGFDYNFNGFGSQIVKPIVLKFLIENTKTK
jgi:acetyl esterase/lipase